MLAALKRLCKPCLPLSAAALMVCPSLSHAAAEDGGSGSRRLLPVSLSWRSDGGDPTAPAGAGFNQEKAAQPDGSVSAQGAAWAGRSTASRLVLADVAPPPHGAPESRLFGDYRRALEKESRRMLDRNPAISWEDAVDEDGYPLRGADRQQRDARRLFSGAGSRLMSGWLERLVEVSAGMRAARGAVEGLRLDVRRDGGFAMGAGPARDSSEVRTSMSLVVVGRPRLEVRSSLPWNLRARVEVPLTASGVRATLSRRFTSEMRGTFTLGSEDDERWVSAGFEVDF